MNKAGYYRYLRKKHLREQCDQHAGKKRLQPMHPFIVFVLTLLGSLATIAVLGFIVSLFL
jgi:hypothetical protein|tara:strand:- start:3479 stop:3658 length:180 start_codon:yes stop_codon:yes gene_type:complete